MRTSFMAEFCGQWGCAAAAKQLTVPAGEPLQCQPYYLKRIQALSSCKCSSKGLCFTNLCEQREYSWPNFAIDLWCDLVNGSRLPEQGNELSTLFPPVAIPFWFLVLRKMPSAVRSSFRKLRESTVVKASEVIELHKYPHWEHRLKCFYKTFYYYLSSHTFIYYFLSACTQMERLLNKLFCCREKAL